MREELEMMLKEGEEELKKKERHLEEVIAAFQNPVFYNIWVSSSLVVQKQLVRSPKYYTVCD